jgi:hypothetical protein
MKETLFLLLAMCTIPVSAQIDSIGIYMKNGDVIQKIDPIKYTKSKINTLEAALTMGLADTSMKTVFRNSSSENVATNSTEFYFYFPQSLNPYMAMEYYMFSPAYSPKNFILVKFKPKKKTRELSVGKINFYFGTSLGVSDDIDAKLITKKIRDEVYLVTIEGNLEQGEYCFMFDGPNGSGAYSSVFDFSIK